MAVKLGGMVPYLKGLLTIKSFNALITWSCMVKLQKALYMQYQSAYGHQIWQDNNLLTLIGSCR